MDNWRVELRENEMGWFWECSDLANNFVCRSSKCFRRSWQALRDFEYMFKDHWSLMSNRSVA